MTPHELARCWLPANDDEARPLLTLATVDADGAPVARTLLLSEVTGTGFAFHTDARSAKAAELETDPRVCLVLLLPEQARQLVVQGRAERQSAERSTAAYGRRSAYLRHLAWLNDAELAGLDDDERRARWAAAVAELPEGRPEPPGTWVGYDVTPSRYVFWEGGPELASRRTEYRLVDGGWVVRHLPG
ncbi:pyridoxamine 5'-phosphate oxidase family protein [uncultured Friedmanniella sp.]|uniref:pyridoxamine 5'-phosphate oxidase family protein n=1 Tax=uncultured Friedmanniella sp. TaxID=335381 RepID=UPI0035CB9AAD